MNRKVGIIGFGYTTPKPKTPGFSYRELIFLAAQMAYQEAKIKPQEVDSFVSVAEDLHEGTSIFDEYVPDQLGAVQMPVHTISGDGIQGIISGCLQILTGTMDLVVIEGHSKASNILTPAHVTSYALDPVLNRPLGLHPYFIAGLEMRAFMEECGASEEDVAKVVAHNKTQATLNKLAPYGSKTTAAKVLKSDPCFEPLRKLHLPEHSDAAYVLVLASDKFAKKRKLKPLWITGMSYFSDSPALETRDWAESVPTRLAAQRAYKMASINDPVSDIDVFEIDDSFGYKELQHLLALGVCRKGKFGELFENGQEILKRLNPSGGSLGTGWMHEATGLHKVLELLLQLRGTKGRLQVKGAKTGLAQSWRGIPTTTCSVLVLQN